MPTFLIGEEKHEAGNPDCPTCAKQMRYVKGQPLKRCECGGLIHNQAIDEADGDGWRGADTFREYRCDRCKKVAWAWDGLTSGPIILHEDNEDGQEPDGLSSSSASSASGS